MRPRAWWLVFAFLGAVISVHGCDCSGQNYILLTATPTEIYANGEAFSTIEAKAYYSGGPVDEGTTVTFRTTDGSLDDKWTEDDATKDTSAYTVGGSATVKLYSSRTPGDVKVTASFETINSENITAEVTVKFTNASKVTNRGLVFKCESRNLGAFDAMLKQTPATPCTVTATTISGEALKSPEVKFMAEAGVVEQDPDSDRLSYLYTANSTGHLPYPKDVPPVEATGEPCIQVSGVTRNPRDGLATLIVYMRGMEWFDDKNKNGTWEPGEDFDDLDAPYVDENDNGVWDSDEPYPDVWKDGAFHKKNGKWDGDTFIWKAFKVLWTGKMKSGMTATMPPSLPPAAAAACQGYFSMITPTKIDVPSRGSGNFKVRVVDDNLNPLASNDDYDTIDIEVEGGDSSGAGQLPYANFNFAGMHLGEGDGHTGDGMVTGGYDISRTWDVTISDPVDHTDGNPIASKLTVTVHYTPDRNGGDTFDTKPMSVSGQIRGGSADGGTPDDGGAD